MKTILITGAGSGIGRAAACALAKRGHSVIATTRTEEEAIALKEFATQQSLALELFKLDITDSSDREKIRDRELDVLITAAGIGETGPLAEIPLERLRELFEVNVFGTIALSQIALATMMKKKKGTVIVVSSVAGRVPIPFLSPYGMTKFALSGGVAAMRDEVHRVEPNVHVSLIEPGAYATGFNQKMFAKKYEWIGEDSAFFSLISALHKEDSLFARTEEKDTKSIVRKIVQAAESSKPGRRYGAPAYQLIAVQIARMLGM